MAHKKGSNAIFFYVYLSIPIILFGRWAQIVIPRDLYNA